MGVYSCSSETLISVLNVQPLPGFTASETSPIHTYFIFIIPNLIINTLAVCERRFNPETLQKLPQRMTISIFYSHKPLGVNSRLPPEVKKSISDGFFIHERQCVLNAAQCFIYYILN